MEYNYLNEMMNDVKNYIEENVDMTDYQTKSALYEKLYDELWLADEITGNASGTYTFNAWEAEEYLSHNWHLLEEALCEFGLENTNVEAKGAEYCDVTIRCYLLGQVLDEVLDELLDELLEEE